MYDPFSDDYNRFRVMTGRKLIELLDRIQHHPGRELYRDWTELQWTIAILDSHFDGLLETTARLSQALTPEHRARQKIIGDREVDVVRSFQGYFSCAYTLYEQAQHLKNRHLCLNNGSEKNCSCERCDTILQELFERDVLPRWQFIQRLRAYFQHRRSPNIIRPQDSTQNAGTDHLLEVDESGSILLRPEAFKAFENGGGAVDYVEERGEIDLLRETQAYHSSVFNYYCWYHSYLRTSNQSVVDDWEDMVHRLKGSIQDSKSPTGDPSFEDAISEYSLTRKDLREVLESLRNGGHQFSAVIEQFPNVSQAETFSVLTNEEVEKASALLGAETNN